jgi:predicted  nucleic acid-binding Zn-ribbon protein
VGKLRQDCNDLHAQNNQLTYLLNKVKAELADKDTLIGRSLSTNDAELQTLKQQLEQKRQESAQLTANLREVRGAWKEAEGDWERKKRELLERQSAVENEARKYKEEYLRICEVLKSKINSAIDNVSYKK